MKKVTKKKMAAMRRYHISLLVFLLALGLVPASLTSGGAFAETEVKESSDSAPKNDDFLTLQAEMQKASKSTTAEIASDFQLAEATQAETYVYTPTVTVYDQINIAGNTIPIFYSSNTLIDAGNEVGLYGSHFLYGHNTSNVFGGLQNLGIGDRFTVTLDGVTRTYQIVNSDLETKSHFEGETVHKTVLSGVTVLTKMKVMRAITAYGEYEGRYYDYILMTCAGTSYGNGDASHRLILMANAV